MRMVSHVKRTPADTIGSNGRCGAIVWRRDGERSERLTIVSKQQ